MYEVRILGYRVWVKIKDLFLGNYSLRLRRLHFEFNFKIEVIIWSCTKKKGNNVKILEF